MTRIKPLALDELPDETRAASPALLKPSTGMLSSLGDFD